MLSGKTCKLAPGIFAYSRMGVKHFGGLGCLLLHLILQVTSFENSGSMRSNRNPSELMR